MNSYRLREINREVSTKPSSLHRYMGEGYQASNIIPVRHRRSQRPLNLTRRSHTDHLVRIAA
jgi:hypothetical protein